MKQSLMVDIAVAIELILIECGSQMLEDIVQLAVKHVGQQLFRPIDLVPQIRLAKHRYSQDFVHSFSFGNELTNSFGTFQSLCSSPTSLSQVEQVFTYLRTAPMFRKFNRLVPAYRVELDLFRLSSLYPP